MLVIRGASIPLRIWRRGVNSITFDLQIVLIRQKCCVLSFFFFFFFFFKEGPQKPRLCSVERLPGFLAFPKDERQKQTISISDVASSGCHSNIVASVVMFPDKTLKI